MGIPGLLKEIGKGERVALAKLAIEHLERNRRPLRIAIDAAIWNFQNQAGQGGKNPALRTLFYRLLKLLALPIEPVFVYDGKNKPLTKRGKTVSRYGTCIPNETSKTLVSLFQFPHHAAPGEAEAECAHLQQHGVVDAVMSQDVDALMFGSTLTLRDWSKEGTRGNKTPTHVSVVDQGRVEKISGLDPEGMILVAMLSGGDYCDGLPGVGSTLACEISRVGTDFASEMIKCFLQDDDKGMREWRDRLRHELTTNESGFFRTKHKKLQVPDDFPNKTILGYYVNPVVTPRNQHDQLEAKWSKIWNREIEISKLRQYTGETFDWQYRSGAKRFVRCFAQPLFQHQLLKILFKDRSFSVDSITGSRMHFISGGIVELRFTAVPADIVKLDLGSEPEASVNQTIDLEEEASENPEELPISDDSRSSSVPLCPSKSRTRLPWDPCTPERWWIPETILQLGLPAIVEDWQQLQRDIAAESIKFATRNCRKTKKSAAQKNQNMPQGALREYLVSQKPKTQPSQQKSNEAIPVKPLVYSEAKAIASPSSLGDFFKSSKVKLVMPESDLGRVPDNITQRRKRPPKQEQPVEAGRTENLDFGCRERRPIESFFGPPARKSSTLDPKGPKPSGEVVQTASIVVRSSQDSFLGGAVSAADKRRVAIASRDSLPGTWKAVDAAGSQVSRISIIDMTNECG